MYTIIIIIIIILISSIIFYNCNQKNDINDNNKEKYLSDNNWYLIDNKENYTNHNNIKEIEVRDLPSSHLLSGQKGVFATQKINKYDIIGEYTGIIKKNDNIDSFNNLYIFNLVDDISIDPEEHGNEIKYVNSYLNIADKPNVSPKLCYIGGYPRILYICIKDIDIGEELLVNYGDDYNEYHIL